MSAPRVLGYDDLHQYLDDAASCEQDLADDLDEEQGGTDKGRENAVRHWAKAEAYREVLTHIERELEWNRGSQGRSQGRPGPRRRRASGVRDRPV